MNVYRGRIILVGQDRAGKTSLKKSLLGLPFDFKEQSTDGKLSHQSSKLKLSKLRTGHLVVRTGQVCLNVWNIQRI